MAPKKRKAEAAAPERVARRSARLAKSSPAVPPLEPRKRKKAAKPPAEKKAKAQHQEDTKENSGDEQQEEAKEEDATDDDAVAKKTVVIEHCKQCNSFKTRATQVKNGLENAVPGITVLLNPDKPRKGCFEIREEGGETFITLPDMKRPFKPMKDLDMEKVISDIVEKIK